MRAYELMVIHVGDLDDQAVQDRIKAVRADIEATGATVANTDFWGRRRFAYEIDHKEDGYYTVFDIDAEPGSLDPVERSLRLADEVVRFKLLRLPDAEAERRRTGSESESAEASE